MHDIGKIGIHEVILNKPGWLTEKERAIMNTHTTIGINILESSTRKILKTAKIIAHQHHERWGGNGYPEKLSGEEIHIYARITAVADAFDAMSHERCYKKASPLPKIFQIFEEERGKQFDPELTDLFLKHKDEFVAILNKYPEDKI